MSVRWSGVLRSHKTVMACCCAAALIILAKPATSQVFFRPFGGVYVGPVEDEPRRPRVTQRMVARLLNEEGLRLIAPLEPQGDLVIATAEDEDGRQMRVFIDPYEGEIVRVRRAPHAPPTESSRREADDPASDERAPNPTRRRPPPAPPEIFGAPTHAHKTSKTPAFASRPPESVAPARRIAPPAPKLPAPPPTPSPFPQATPAAPPPPPVATLPKVEPPKGEPIKTEPLQPAPAKIEATKPEPRAATPNASPPPGPTTAGPSPAAPPVKPASHSESATNVKATATAPVPASAGGVALPAVRSSSPLLEIERSEAEKKAAQKRNGG